MVPRPSVLLNIPKTGTSFARRFFDSADLLAFRRRCGVDRLSVPSRAGMHLARLLKRHGIAYGNLNCRVRYPHTGYSELPRALRACPKICALRDVAGWYRSYCVFYTHAPVMRHALLWRAIRLLVDGIDRERDANVRAVLLKHRREFLERFEGEDASADALQDVSAEFLVWFTQTVRLEYMMRRRFGLDARAEQLGFLTFRTIALLFEDPRRVLGLRTEAFDAYFASGRYLNDLRCDHVLDCARLNEQLSALMVRELDYDPRIVEFLSEHAPRHNVSPDGPARRYAGALEERNLLGRIRAQEAVYETYLLPLAGAWRGAA